MKALVSGPCWEPTVPVESGALIRRIARRSSPSSLAALSMIGSTAAAIWFCPGPRWAPLGVELVTMVMPR